MRPPRCDVCGTGLSDDGALIDFVPRPDDVAWRERALESEVIGHPPDSAWLCGRHSRCGALLATRLDVARGLALLRTADEGVEVKGQIPPHLRVSQWALILRRALPDFAVELGSDDVSIEFDAQSTYFEDGEIPLGAANGVDAESWDVSGHLAQTGVTVFSIYWKTGGLARTDVHIGAVYPRSEGWRVWLTPEPGSATFDWRHLDIEGEPSPLMKELLVRYGLEEALEHVA